MKKTADWIAIDQGATTLRVIRRVRSRLTVVPSPKGLRGRGITALPEQGLVRNLDVPGLQDPQALYEHLTVNLGQYLPLSPAEVVWDGRVQGSHILLAAGRKTSCASAQALLTEHGLEPDTLTLAPLALYRTLLALVPDAAAGAHLILDQGVQLRAYLFTNAQLIGQRDWPADTEAGVEDAKRWAQQLAGLDSPTLWVAGGGAHKISQQHPDIRLIDPSPLVATPLENPPAWALAVGLALPDTDTISVPNLFPYRERQAREAKNRFIQQGGTLAGLSLVLLLVGYAAAEQAHRHATADLAYLQQAKAKWAMQGDLLQKLKAQRSALLDRLDATEKLLAGRDLPAQVVSTLRTGLPAGIQLTAIRQTSNFWTLEGRTHDNEAVSQLLVILQAQGWQPVLTQIRKTDPADPWGTFALQFSPEKKTEAPHVAKP